MQSFKLINALPAFSQVATIMDTQIDVFIRGVATFALAIAVVQLYFRRSPTRNCILEQ